MESDTRPIIPQTSSGPSSGESTPIMVDRSSPSIWRLPRSLSRSADENVSSNRTLATLGGVFSPVALSMFSTLLFLRAGFVVGQSGILQTVAELLLAYVILSLTVLSICAISTNGAIEGGGAYYMISRALGPEFGGSIGFLFFVANIFACAMYVSGFVEGMIENFGDGGTLVADGAGMPSGTRWWSYLYSTVVLAICLGVCIVGGSMFARTSTLILLIVIVSTLSVIISIFAQNHVIEVEIPQSNTIVYHNGTSNNITGNYTGLLGSTFKKNLYSNYTVDYNSGNHMDFAAVFAILFSSVTGIMNGANMSGELKDPSMSIPKGTLCAIAFTFLTYLILCILIGGSNDRFLLINDYGFLQAINLWPPFVVIGIFAATLSAALGNLIGASRVLQALANDHLFGWLLKPATVTTGAGNPFVAVLISWILVQLILLIGSLNAIAPATSIFFLLSYSATNLACLALEVASAPNFRPTFKYFTWHTCLLGLVGSIVMCFMISPIYTSLAIIILLILIIVLHVRSLPTQWGSISQALIFHQVRKYLLMLDARKSHVKYWRPQILLMVANPRHCCELIDFINDIKKGGLFVIGHVKLGHLNDYEADPSVEADSYWASLVDHLKIKAFTETTLSDSVVNGLHQLVRLSGLGGMKVNTVCFGFFDNSSPLDSLVKTKMRKRRFFGTVQSSSFSQVENYWPEIRKGMDERCLNAPEYVAMIKDCIKMKKNVCLCRHFNQLDKTALFSAAVPYYIDVWPLNLFRPGTSAYFDNACLFMLQLACIINMVPGWKSNTVLRVFLCVARADKVEIKQKKLTEFLRQLRILAKIEIVSLDPILFDTLDPSIAESTDFVNMHEYKDVSEDFLQTVNELVASQSTHTAVTFLYLPVPPHEEVNALQYLAKLEILTNGLPPTVLVHGLHPVTSTTL